MKNAHLNTMLEHSSEFVKVSDEFNHLVKIPYWRNSNVIFIPKGESFLEVLKEVKKKISATKFEGEFLDLSIEIFSKKSVRITFKEAERLLALSMESIIERVTIIKLSFLNAEDIYDTEVMKIIFILETNKNIIAKSKDSLIKGNISNKEWSMQQESTYNLLLLYSNIIGIKEANLDVIIRSTSNMLKEYLEEGISQWQLQ